MGRLVSSRQSGLAFGSQACQVKGGKVSDKKSFTRDTLHSVGSASGSTPGSTPGSTLRNRDSVSRNYNHRSRVSPDRTAYRFGSRQKREKGR